MKVFKLIFSISLSVIFVVSTITVLFSASSVLRAGLETYVFKVDNCYDRYAYEAVPLKEVGESTTTTKEKPNCEEINKNETRRRLSEGLATLIVATPLAWLTFKKSQSLLKEERG